MKRRASAAGPALLLRGHRLGRSRQLTSPRLPPRRRSRESRRTVIGIDAEDLLAFPENTDPPLPTDAKETQSGSSPGHRGHSPTHSSIITSSVTADAVKRLAKQTGFDLVGITSAEPTLESLFYPEWLKRGFAGDMRYLEGRRGEMRSDPKSLLPSAKSVISIGLVYNTEDPYSTEVSCGDRGWISRYAWGEDYHQVIRQKLDRLVELIHDEVRAFDYKVCVDTAPLLERA